MKSFITILIVSAVLQWLLPYWWVMAPVAFLAGFSFKNSPFIAFGQGFLAIALLWFGYSLAIDILTHSILSKKVAEMITGSPNQWLILLITTLVGGLVGGFSSLAGSLWSKVS